MLFDVDALHILAVGAAGSGVAAGVTMVRADYSTWIEEIDSQQVFGIKFKIDR